MSKSPPPVSSSHRFFNFLRSILPLLVLAGTIACGGGSSTPNSVGGGGGGGGGSGGGGTGANCSQPAPFPVTTSPVAQGGLAVGLNPIPATYMDLHMGSSNLPWPTVPFGGLRLWDTATGWAQINTAQGVYDWTNLDGFVSAAQAHGVDLLYNLARTPAWISSNPSDSTCAYDTSAEGGPGQCDPPSDLNADGSGTDAAWIDWVTAVATRNVTKGQIKYYEIWNEWNASLFWAGSKANSTRTHGAGCTLRRGRATARPSLQSQQQLQRRDGD